MNKYLKNINRLVSVDQRRNGLCFESGCSPEKKVSRERESASTKNLLMPPPRILSPPVQNDSHPVSQPI